MEPGVPSPKFHAYVNGGVPPTGGVRYWNENTVAPSSPAPAGETAKSSVRRSAGGGGVAGGGASGGVGSTGVVGGGASLLRSRSSGKLKGPPGQSRSVAPPVHRSS